ncbi:MAG: glycosyltransferase family 2 protein [Flavobacterium sp.]|uniref:glycosyltransferase family 2 protein n=1 Tax=Flavobacterium sp. TaxID=239 RepID=UPI0012029530|nr:glycosyltransferase family A protein [Flavobacterium sp.]RZJ66076.1 MAG: glycosyltransferase family 2 protein [Flavobacterium sp.]
MEKVKLVNTPRISVIIPCFNRAHFLDRTLQSVLDQTLADWECIIINSGSDDTKQVAQKWVEKDSRFSYFEKENQGPSSARNLGVAKSSAPYIFPLDDDDYIESGYFEKAVAILDADPEIKVVHARVMQFGHITGELVLPKYSYDALLLRNCIICCSFYRRTDFDRVKGYDDNLFILEDWDFWLSMLDDNSKVHRIDEFMYNYRKHPSGSLVNSFSDDRRNHQDHLDRIYKKHVDTYLAHHGNPMMLYRENLKLLEFQKKVMSNPLFRFAKWFRKKI